MADTRGIYKKFYIERADGDPTGKHQACNYFVIDLVHDENAEAALRAYAKSCAKKRPQLAKDIRWALKTKSFSAALKLKMEQEGTPIPLKEAR